MNNTTFVELTYPRTEGNKKYIEISLLDTRAVDDIRIHFDFDRDGWVISQASVFEWDIADEECNPDWQEVAFIQACFIYPDEE